MYLVFSCTLIICKKKYTVPGTASRAFCLKQIEDNSYVSDFGIRENLECTNLNSRPIRSRISRALYSNRGEKKI